MNNTARLLSIAQAMVFRHPGHGSQKVHGRRYGASGEVLEVGKYKRQDVVAGGKGKGGGSKPSSGDAEKGKKLLGKVLTINDENSAAVQEHLADLSLLPDGLVKRMGKKATVHLGDRPMTELDSNQKLKGVHPPGWPPGSTWDELGGAYNGLAKTVSVGKGSAGSGCISTALHEYGHAVQSGIMNQKQYNRLQDIHAKIYNKLPAYLQQGGPGKGQGVSETWAEGFATVIKDRNRATKEYGPDFVTLVDEISR